MRLALSSLVASGALAACPDFLPRLQALLAQVPTSREFQFLNDVFYPVVGRRLVLEKFRPVFDLKACSKRVLGCLVLPKSGEGKEIRVEWIDQPGKAPWVEVLESARVLKIPRDIHFNDLPEHGRTEIQQLLIGHELHPYLTSPEIRAEREALDEPPLFLKKSQEDAIVALKEADQAGQRKLLLVSPTAWGKTEVLKRVLQQRLERSQQKLHLIVADQNGLTLQLKKEMQELSQTTPLRILHWGGSGTPAGKVEDLIRKADESREPLVLITTIQSLKATLKRNGWDEGLEALRPKLATLVYDEAHHAGAPEAKELIEGLIDHADSKTTLLGMTATPVHSKVGIQQFFGDGAYWAYLDSGKAYRSLDQVVDQLSTAIQRGELTPFDHTYFITPQSVGVSESLFTPNAGGRLVLDPQNYDMLFKRMLPLFAKHEHGFLATGTIEEAERISSYLNQVTHGKRFAVLHSGLSKPERQEIERLYRSGEINYLITVKYLDEGVRYPKMSLYVDLNSNIGARQFLQRIGRILALEPGKEAVDVVSLMELHESGVKEHIALIDQVLAGKFELPRPVGQSHAAIPTPEGFFPEPHVFSLNVEEMREELTRIRDQLHAFWEHSEISPARRAALDMLAYLEKTGFVELPKKSKELSLYERLVKYRDHPEFQEELKKYPHAWALVEKYIARIELGSAKQAALDTLAYIEKSEFKEVPKVSKDYSLYRRFAKYRDYPEFQDELKKHPKAWAVVQNFMSSPAKQAALETLAFIEKTGFTELPKQSTNSALYARFLHYRDNPEFQEELKKHPHAWALVEEFFTRIELGPAKQAALGTLAYMKKSGFTELPTGAKDKALYTRYLRYRDTPEFQEELKKYPQAWALMEKFMAGPARQAARDTLAYIEESGFTEVPKVSQNSALYERFAKYRDTPEFQEELKQHPKAWAVVEKFMVSPAKQAALDALAYMKESGFTDLPKKSKYQPLYKRISRYRDNPEFQEELKKFPQAWALVEEYIARLELGSAKQAALDTLAYMKESGFAELPKKSKNNALYKRFVRYRDNSEFQEELKKHPQVWELFEMKYLNRGGSSETTDRIRDEN